MMKGQMKVLDLSVVHDSYPAQLCYRNAQEREVTLYSLLTRVKLWRSARSPDPGETQSSD